MCRMRIWLPQYPTAFTLSNKRRAKYYSREDELPKKYSSLLGQKYGFIAHKGKEYLVDLVTKEKVIKNSKSVGTPKKKPINGQKLYNGDYSYFERIKIKTSLREYIQPHLQGKYMGSFPVKITFDVYANTPQDFDNHVSIYKKMFVDLLVEFGVIPNDTQDYITAYEENLFKVENQNERGIYITIAPKGHGNNGKVSGVGEIKPAF